MPVLDLCKHRAMSMDLRRAYEGSLARFAGPLTLGCNVVDPMT